ncbi:hypothetical protein QBC43DRAFT_285421 [Cladorrhinum sp. PSN259]|nr:hypothetical protein QBC43DRAFT_285421 [Cladorrhinum sp. PSN259]
MKETWAILLKVVFWILKAFRLSILAIPISPFRLLPSKMAAQGHVGEDVEEPYQRVYPVAGGQSQGQQHANAISQGSGEAPLPLPNIPSQGVSRSILWPSTTTEPSEYVSTAHLYPPTGCRPTWDGEPETFYPFMNFLIDVYNSDAPFGHLGRSEHIWWIINLVPSPRILELEWYIEQNGNPGPDSSEFLDELGPCTQPNPPLDPLKLMDELLRLFGNDPRNNETGQLISRVPRMGDEDGDALRSRWNELFRRSLLGPPPSYTAAQSGGPSLEEAGGTARG